jgi:translocation and assembly module TamA
MMRLVSRSRPHFLRTVVFTIAISLAPVGSAAAFDFFGLFGRGEEPPPPSPEALPYELTIDIVGEDTGLTRAIEDVSSLHRLRADAPPDADSLARRAQSDLIPVIDALWGSGYYNAAVTIEVAGVPLQLGIDRVQAAIAAAQPFLARELVPIRIVAVTGDLFLVRNLDIIDSETGAALGPGLPEDVVALDPGDPAAAARILSAQARIIDYYREQARPFADVTDLQPTVDHPRRAMDLRIAIAPGPTAGLGPIVITGNENIDESVIRSFIYTEPGDPYSPTALANMRTSIGRLEAVSSVRIREGESLDADGNLPLSLEITERLPRAFGVSGQYSTVDGPSARIYWTHRNLFGGAERLRLEASAFYLIQGRDRGFVDRRNFVDDLGGRVSASFLKPALWGTRNDFLADALVERDRTEAYESRLANVTLGVRHRFSDTFSIQGGVEVERGRATDILGRNDYTLVGLPLSLTYDSTDSALEPTQGWRVTGGVTPYARALGSSLDMVVSRATASTYFALDDRARFVLAGRVGFGSIVGADLNDVPPNRRFYAGGGGSVRGFAFRSLSPMVNGVPIGGRSLIEASLEARLRVTDTIGIVPFVDAGGAFRESYPDFGERVRVAAGLGLRYYTGIGPIRFDVAIPLQRERGQRGYGIYLGIGQAF